VAPPDSRSELLGHGVERRRHRGTQGVGEPVHQSLQQGALPHVDGTARQHRPGRQQPTGHVLDEDRTAAEVVEQSGPVGPP
jgi:hypothetical protein